MNELRIPLRPLSRVLAARERGENPDSIERANIRDRHDRLRDTLRQRAETRLLMLAVVFSVLFGTVAMRMGALAAGEGADTVADGPATTSIVAQRSDITDRQGRLLATNMLTKALYVQTRDLVNPTHAAAELARIFPDMDEATLLRRFTDGRRFLWLRRTLSPEQQQAVHDIGEPGLLLGRREMRLYPNGPLAAHALGGVKFVHEGVEAAELQGIAGVEAALDDRLRDPEGDGTPVALALDLVAQTVVEEVLEGGMRVMGASGATAVLMKVATGEILAYASLPDFDPNDRPAPPRDAAEAARDPLFDRAALGLYEQGSTFKLFTVAQALEEGIARPGTLIDTRGPLRMAGFSITDFRNHGPQLTLTDVLVKSSNTGTARLAQAIGPERQRGFLARLGLLEPPPVELSGVGRAVPLVPQRWGELSAMTISYGHGVSVSAVQLAAAYASLVNGGTRVTPTLLRQNAPPPSGERIVSAETSAILREMLRGVVTQGTASMAEVPGYAVGGKTGTADKPKPTGGYYEDRVIATFAGIFPAHAPEYVLVLSLDEPQVRALGETKRTAGWTAVPVAAEVIRRTAPVLGLRPEIAPGDGFALRLTAQ